MLRRLGCGAEMRRLADAAAASCGERLRFAEEKDALVFCVKDYGRFSPQPKMEESPSNRGRGLA